MEVTTTTAKKKVATDRHPLAVAFGEYLKGVRKNSDKSDMRPGPTSQLTKRSKPAPPPNAVALKCQSFDS